MCTSRKWTNHVGAVSALIFALQCLSAAAQSTAKPPGAELDGLSIVYQLDAGVIGVTYGRRWLAGPNFTSTVQAGTVGTVNVRVRGMDARRNPVPVTPEWTIPDPEMIEVTAGRDNEFRITVKQPGEARLIVGAQGYSLELLVTARDLGNAMQVAIAELDSKRPASDKAAVPAGPGIRVDQGRQIGSTSRKTAPLASPGASLTST